MQQNTSISNALSWPVPASKSQHHFTSEAHVFSSTASLLLRHFSPPPPPLSSSTIYRFLRHPSPPQPSFSVFTPLSDSSHYSLSLPTRAQTPQRKSNFTRNDNTNKHYQLRRLTFLFLCAVADAATPVPSTCDTTALSSADSTMTSPS